MQRDCLCKRESASLLARGPAAESKSAGPSGERLLVSAQQRRRAAARAREEAEEEESKSSFLPLPLLFFFVFAAFVAVVKVETEGEQLRLGRRGQDDDAPRGAHGRGALPRRREGRRDSPRRSWPKEPSGETRRS